jgi:metallo-beta-lactamase family protein
MIGAMDLGIADHCERASREQATQIAIFAISRPIVEIDWLALRRPVRRGIFLTHGEEPALEGLIERVAERTIPTSQIFNPVLDDVHELSTAAPTPIEVSHRLRLAPEAVVNLDWHNDMSKLILDINARIEAAGDDRARGVIIRKLKRALDQE